jgi:hypothetical protein
LGALCGGFFRAMSVRFSSLMHFALWTAQTMTCDEFLYCHDIVLGLSKILDGMSAPNHFVA